MSICVLYGRCDEEPLAPYQPFTEALRDLVDRAPSLIDDPRLAAHLDVLARILPELSARDGASAEEEPAVDRHRLFEAVAGLIASGRPGRVLLVIDDLHWADGPTLMMLRYLIRRCPVALVVAATARDSHDEASRLADLTVDLRREGVVDRFALRGLDADTAGQLIAARAGVAPHPDFVRWTQARTQGNPFFIQEILRGLSDTDTEHVVGRPDRALLARAGVPEGVKDLVAQRRSRLSAATAESLEIAAVIGGEFDVRLLERLLGGREPTLAACDEALASGLIVETSGQPGRLSFAHALVREALYETLSATRRASLHERIGEALEDGASAGGPAELAHHFLAARALVGPAKGVRYAIDAAQAAGRALAWEEEIEHYGAALRALDEDGSDDDATRCRILLAMASAQVTLGDPNPKPAYARVAAIAKRHRLEHVLARAAVGSARVFEYGIVDQDAIALLEDALVLLGDEDSPERARVLGRLAETLYQRPDSIERRDTLSREALEVARRIGNPTGLVAVLNARAYAIGGPDRVSEQIELLTEPSA